MHPIKPNHTMKRRPLVLACAAALAPSVRAQQRAQPKRVGVLALGDAQGSAASVAVVANLKTALRDLGWIEGETIVFEVRSAQGRAEQLPELARELVALAP